jgi:hypothetical protein
MGVKIYFSSTKSLNYVKYFLTIWWNRHRRFQCKENMTVCKKVWNFRPTDNNFETWRNTQLCGQDKHSLAIRRTVTYTEERC